MNKYLYLTTIAILTLSCNSNNFNTFGLTNTDVENEGLKGKVKIVIDSTFSAKEMFGEIIKDTLKQAKRTFFNKKGDLIQNHYYADYEYSYEYLKDKKITKITRNGEKFVSAITTYNQKRLPIRLDEVGQDGLLFGRWNYTYDNFFRLTNVIYYGYDGKIDRKVVLTYNSDNSYEQKIFESYEYTVTKYNPDNEILETLVYDYDLEDDEIGDLEQKWTYPDDKNITIFIYSRGDLEEKICKTKDEYGMAIKSIIYDEDGELEETYSWKYTYDKTGNWIKYIEYIDNKPVEIRERKITYY